jgi:hypothetical protein
MDPPRRLDRVADWWNEHDELVYGAWALACTTYAASVFYSYLLVQTRGSWSAPLDDVFIHFDYARALARGYPFQWSEGNGYSSGNTSLTYPIVLALGYWAGFRKLLLVVWAAIVAVASVFGFLLAAGRVAAAGKVGWARFLVPPAVLSMGALDWTLWSGMENAFHLGLWGVCLLAALAQRNATERSLAALDRKIESRAVRSAWLLGATGALLCLTRPESGVCVAVFAVWCAWPARARGNRRAATILAAASVPALAVLGVQALVNRLLTGEWSQAGSVAKLFLANPYMSPGDMLDRYLSLLGYIVPRLTMHHFAEYHGLGLLVPALALAALAHPRLRGVALCLWAQVVAWLLLVSLNNQVRWHNERYAMPAVAWLLVLAALGVAAITARGAGTWARVWPARAALAGGLCVLYWVGQAPRMADQIWFFGRASRNILDQHVMTGLLLEKMNVERVLVGDAGAITYASDRPGLDLIGLGGYHAFPFARATVHGLGASLELIERMPPGERPTVMAIYPGWWGDLPVYFGRYLTAIPVRGNVICGGAEKVVYQADWSAMDRRGAPRTLADDEHIVDELDVADLLSERLHAYRLVKPGVGFPQYRVLGDPVDPRRDLFDAGRIVPAGETERAVLQAPEGPGRLLVRVAPEQSMRTTVSIAGKAVGTLSAEPRVGVWQEVSLPLPPDLGSKIEIELTPETPTTHFHIWVVGP